MKNLLLTAIAAVLVVGCGESQQSTPQAEPVEPVAEVPAQPSSPPPEAQPVEPVAEAATPEPPTAKARDISIHEAAGTGNIEAVKQHLAAGTDVNAKDKRGLTPLHIAAGAGRKEIVELLITEGADVNAKLVSDGPHKGKTPLNAANDTNHPEIADLLRKYGGKTSEELKAEGK